MRRTRVGLAERSPQEELVERVQQDSSRAGFSDRSGFGLAVKLRSAQARHSPMPGGEQRKRSVSAIYALCSFDLLQSRIF